LLCHHIRILELGPDPAFALDVEHVREAAHADPEWMHRSGSKVTVMSGVRRSAVVWSQVYPNCFEHVRNKGERLGLDPLRRNGVHPDRPGTVAVPRDDRLCVGEALISRCTTMPRFGSYLNMSADARPPRGVNDSATLG